MRWRNTSDSYGLVSIALHWLVALTIFGLFGLGLWMVELGYYDAWYQRAPALHQSIGLVLFAVVVVRLLWRFAEPVPRALASQSVLERRGAVLVHGLLYLLLLGLLVSGYLIGTAGGRGIPVFGLFEVPALPMQFEDQEDVAGEIHAWLAWSLIILAAGHALAAVKHHVIDRDATLVRMLGGSRRIPNPSTKEK